MGDMIKKNVICVYSWLWDLFVKDAYIRRLKIKLDDLYKKADPTYYIICCKDKSLEVVGLFGYIGIFLQMINYAIDNGMIPVIDMKNYRNSLIDEDEIGAVNGWDRLFMPLEAESLNDIYSNGKYVIGNHLETDWNNRPTISEYHRRDHYWHWAYLYKHFIRLSDETQKYCDIECNKLFLGQDMDNVLGVIARGTDLLTAKGHAIQPSIEQLKSKISDTLKEHRFDKIYLATESSKIEESIVKEFGDIVITNKRTYYDNVDYSHGLALANVPGKTRYERNLEYLSSIEMISRCGGLVAGICGGSIGAFNINYGRYRYVYFFELGIVK